MAGADGSITYSTRLDNRELEQDLKEQKETIEHLEGALKREKSQAAELGKELSKATREAASLQNQIQKNADKRLPIAQQVSNLGGRLDEAKAKLAALQDEAQRVDAALANPNLKDSASIEAFGDAKARQADVTKELAAQQAIVDKLQGQFDQADAKLEMVDTTAKRLASDFQAAQENTRRITLEVEASNMASQRYEQQLTAAKDRAGALEKELRETVPVSKAIADGVQEMNTKMEKFTNRVKGLAKRVFVFTLITTALRSVKNWMGKVLTANSESAAAIARLKGALLTLIQPLVSVIIPAFTKFVNVLAMVINKIAAFFAALRGTSVKSTQEAAKALYEETNALNKTGSAAKKAGKSLASFDEINKLSDSNADAGGTTSATAPDFSAAVSDMDVDTDKLREILGLVGAIAAGLLAWKIASAFTGDLSTLAGIALIAAGAFALFYNWVDALSNGIDWGNLLGMLAGLAAMVAGLYIVLGPTAAAIGLLVGGFMLLVAGFNDMLKSGMNLQNTLTVIAGLIGAGLGISLLTGSWIPLLIAGFASALLALVYFTGHGEEFVEGLRKVLDGFGQFFQGVFTGDMEMAAEGLAKVWEGLKQSFTAIIDSIKDGWNMLLQFIEAKAPEFLSFFKTLEKYVCDYVAAAKDIFSGLVDFIAGVFTGDWSRAWDGVKQIFTGVFNGIISAVEAAVNFMIDGINWLITQINKVSFDVPDWVPGIGGNTWGVNISPIESLELPRLAAGAVIPPNREFMAVLGDQKSGTNIEAPAELIRQMVIEGIRAANGGQNITIEFTGDLAALARLLNPHIKNENNRVGGSLVVSR